MTCVAPLTLWLMGFGTLGSLVLALALFTIALAIFAGPTSVQLMEGFPVAYRFTGMALSWNIAAVVFGGLVSLSALLLHNHLQAPLLATLIWKSVHATIFVGVTISVVGVATLAVLWPEVPADSSDE